jgi:hypothetical protein
MALRYFFPMTVGSFSLNLDNIAEISSKPRSLSSKIPSSVLTVGSWSD